MNKRFNTSFSKTMFIGFTLSILANSAFAENLSDIFNLAVENDPEIRQARAEFNATHTNIAQGRALLLPSLTLTANIGREASAPEPDFSFSDNFSSKGYGLNIRQNLLNFESWYQFQGVKKNDLAAAANLAQAEQQLIIRVATAYFNVLRNIDNLASFQAQLDASERVLEQTTQRFEVGLIPITDVYDSQASADLDRVNLLVEQNNLSQSYEALDAITGQSYSNIDTLNEDFPIVPIAPASMEEWDALAQANNLDVKAAELNYEAQQENAKAARAAMFPTVELTASYNWSESGNTFSFFQNTASERASVTLGFSYPLYAGGGNGARKRQAYYNRDASEEALLRTQRSSTQSTRNNYRSVQSDVLTVSARDQAIISARSALEAVEVGAEVGTRNIVDVVISQQNLYQALRNHANARYDYIINTLNLKQSAGVLNPQDVIDLNEWLE